MCFPHKCTTLYDGSRSYALQREREKGSLSRSCALQRERERKAVWFKQNYEMHVSLRVHTLITPISRCARPLLGAHSHEYVCTTIAKCSHLSEVPWAWWVTFLKCQACSHHSQSEMVLPKVPLELHCRQLTSQHGTLPAIAHCRITLTISVNWLCNYVVACAYHNNTKPRSTRFNMSMWKFCVFNLKCHGGLFRAARFQCKQACRNRIECLLIFWRTQLA